MIQNLFTQIAQSPTLQAVSLLITIGSLFIFLFKLIWPGIRFARTAVTKGVKRAYVTSLKTIMRRVRDDARDVRIIIARLGHYVFFAIAGMLIPIIFHIAILSNVTVLKDAGLYSPEPLKVEFWKMALSLLTAIPIGAAFSWITLAPMFRLIYYCWLMRRFVTRQIGSADSR